MKMNRRMALLLAFVLACLSLCAAGSSYDSGFEPTPPGPFPDAYANYQILPFSFSPNKLYALIYPKRSVLYETQDERLLLAELKPFCVVTEIPLGYSNLAANARSYYAVNWAKDSSAIVVIEGIRWGPDKVLLVTLHNGQAGKIVDLAAEVRSQVQPDFDKAKPEHYNGTFDFVFDSEDRRIFDDQNGITGERGWDINERGQVIIDCVCTTDPKRMEAHSWAVRFQGTWDISKGRFVQKK